MHNPLLYIYRYSMERSLMRVEWWRISGTDSTWKWKCSRRILKCFVIRNYLQEGWWVCTKRIWKGLPSCFYVGSVTGKSYWEKKRWRFRFRQADVCDRFLWLNLYNLEIWNKYSGQFGEQFRQLELLYDETCSIVSWESTEADEHLHERWIREFCIQVPDKEIRKQLEQIIKQQYQEQGNGRSHRDRHRVGACLFFTEN